MSIHTYTTLETSIFIYLLRDGQGVRCALPAVRALTGRTGEARVALARAGGERVGRRRRDTRAVAAADLPQGLAAVAAMGVVGLPER